MAAWIEDGVVVFLLYAIEAQRLVELSFGISVTRERDDAFAISVRDEGAGLPADFDLREAKGLGMRIVNSFAEQLDAKVVVRAREPGTEFVLSIPLRVLSEAGSDRSSNR